jgi:glyceraldehyde-3-phosphate dehydrogenase (ferredoxin)
MEHGIAGVIYGGTFIDEDFRDRKVADEWFKDKYQKRWQPRTLKRQPNIVLIPI